MGRHQWGTSMFPLLVHVIALFPIMGPHQHSVSPPIIHISSGSGTHQSGTCRNQSGTYFHIFGVPKTDFWHIQRNFLWKKKNGPNSPDLNFLKNKVTRFLEQPNVFLCENSHSCKFWKTFVISSMRVFFFFKCNF